MENRLEIASRMSADSFGHLDKKLRIASVIGEHALYNIDRDVFMYNEDEFEWKWDDVFFLLFFPLLIFVLPLMYTCINGLVSSLYGTVL